MLQGEDGHGGGPDGIDLLTTTCSSNDKDGDGNRENRPGKVPGLKQKTGQGSLSVTLHEK